MKTILTLSIATCLALGSAQLAQARGFGGAHPQESSSEEHHASGSQSHTAGGESEEHHSSGNEASTYHPSSTEAHHSSTEAEGNRAGSSAAAGSHSQGADAQSYQSSEKTKNPQASGAQGAAAGAAAANRNEPQASGAEGAAAGAAAANRNQPAYSGAQGAAAGATAANRNQPAYSGAQGAAAGAAAANRNQPAYSGAEGAAAGAAVANRNSPQMSGAEGAAAGAAIANNNNASQMSGAQGAVAGYAAAGGTTGGAYNAGLPTDGGFGGSAAAPGAMAYATSSHMTQPVDSRGLAAQGAGVRSSYNGGGTFDKNWYGAHPDAWHAAGWGAGDTWHTASWNTVVPMLDVVGSVEPIPYNYGTSITYQGNQVFNDGQPVATCDQYYQQASALAQSAPPANPQSNWMPLGVFALVQSDQTAPHYVMQLAMNKSGAIAGNYCDLISNSVHPIQGAVDKTTQRVAWTVGSNKNTVGETGLYNLTNNEGPALIHMGPDKTQQWTLVRLKQPDQQNPGN